MSIEKIVLFVNATDEDFTGYWNNVPELIKAGASRHMELWRARHYAKHLIDRELNKLGMKTDNQTEREKFLKQIVIEDETIEVPQSNVVSELANINLPEKEDSPKKRGRPAKETNTQEETFEGLES